MKDTCIAIIQKQIILKIIIWESYKTLMQIWKDFCRMILASPSEGQTCKLMPNFKSLHALLGKY